MKLKAKNLMVATVDKLNECIDLVCEMKLGNMIKDLTKEEKIIYKELESSVYALSEEMDLSLEN